jgi:hypothetical protein
MSKPPGSSGSPDGSNPNAFLDWRNTPVAAPIVNEKRCPKCKLTKPMTDFPKRQRGGVRSRCKACRVALAKDYRHRAPPLGEIVLTEGQVARFWSYVDKSPGQGPKGECWEWTGAKDRRGYGHFTIRGRHLKAARVAWFIHYGVDLGEKHACHTCDNPPCCNPTCLFDGTPSDNIQDAIAKGRIRVAPPKPPRPNTYRGEGHPNAKLTEPDVRDILARCPPETHAALAKEKGVSRVVVWKIVNRKMWKHVS